MAETYFMWLYMKIRYSTKCNSNQKWNNDKCQCECHACKKDYSWNPSSCICGNSRHLKSIVDESVIAWDEIKSVTDSASTNVTISRKVASPVSISTIDKKGRYKMDSYILYTSLLVTILLFMIAIVFYRYEKHNPKQKILIY